MFVQLKCHLCAGVKPQHDAATAAKLSTSFWLLLEAAGRHMPVLQRPRASRSAACVATGELASVHADRALPIGMPGCSMCSRGLPWVCVSLSQSADNGQALLPRMCQFRAEQHPRWQAPRQCQPACFCSIQKFVCACNSFLKGTHSCASCAWLIFCIKGQWSSLEQTRECARCMSVCCLCNISCTTTNTPRPRLNGSHGAILGLRAGQGRLQQRALLAIKPWQVRPEAKRALLQNVYIC